MANLNDLQRLLRSSIRYEFDDDRNFEITDYYTGKSIKLDLSRMTEEMFEELVVEDDDEYDEDYEDEEL